MTDKEFMKVVVERARKNHPEYVWTHARSMTADLWEVMVHEMVGTTAYYQHKVWDRRQLTIAHGLTLSMAERMIDLENENMALELDARIYDAHPHAH